MQSDTTEFIIIMQMDSRSKESKQKIVCNSLD